MKFLVLLGVTLAMNMTGPTGPYPASVFAPGMISTGDYESSPELSPDGQTLYFLRNSPDFNFYTIYISHRSGDTWSKPEVAPFSGHYSDADPYITRDNKQLYFISNRPLQGVGAPQNNLDIWVMDRQANGEWGQPRHLPTPINSERDEYFPRTAADGTLYFGSERDGGYGACDIYRAKLSSNGQYETPQNLGPSINTSEPEYEPSIAPDQSYMILMANRKEGLGKGDLYISYQENGNWTKPKNLGKPINSNGYELGPMITPDGKYLMFSSSRAASFPLRSQTSTAEYEEKLHSPGNGLGDIYVIDIRAVPLRQK